MFRWAIGLGLLVAIGVWVSRSPSKPETPAAPPPEVVHEPLAESDREFLWDCEHFGNVLAADGWKVVSRSLKNADRDQLAATLHEEFTAVVVPVVLRKSGESASPIQLDRTELHANSEATVTSSGFVDWLLGIRQEFGAGEAVNASLKLLSLSPRDRDDLDGVWTAKMLLRLWGKTTDGRPREAFVSFDSVLLQPTADNLATGGWWKTCRVTRVDRLSADDWLMRDITAESGLDAESLFDNWKRPRNERVVTTGGIYLCDFNRDAAPDILVTDPDVEHSLRLYKNVKSGRFRDVTYDMGLKDFPGVRHAAFADIDGDGWEDLVLPGFAVYRNRMGQKFQDASHASNLLSTIDQVGDEGLTGLSVADYNQDGRIDFYVTRGDSTNFREGSWIDGRSGNEPNNQLLRNEGGGRFRDVTKEAGADGGPRSTFTANWLDADNDGRPDLYVIHEFGPGALLVNQGDGTFQEREIAESSGDFGSMGLASGDVDNDGRIDLFVSNMYSKAGNRVMDNLPRGFYNDDVTAKLRRMVAGSQLHLNRGLKDGRWNFEAVGAEREVARVGWSWGAAMADLNNDGWLDLHATAGFMSYDQTKPDG